MHEHTCCDATAWSSLGAGELGVAGTATLLKSPSRKTGLVITLSASRSNGSNGPCTPLVVETPLLPWGVEGVASDS